MPVVCHAFNEEGGAIHHGHGRLITNGLIAHLRQVRMCTAFKQLRRLSFGGLRRRHEQVMWRGRRAAAHAMDLFVNFSARHKSTFHSHTRRHSRNRRSDISHHGAYDSLCSQLGSFSPPTIPHAAMPLGASSGASWRVRTVRMSASRASHYRHYYLHRRIPRRTSPPHTTRRCTRSLRESRHSPSPLLRALCIGSARTNASNKQEAARRRPHRKTTPQDHTPTYRCEECMAPDPNRGSMRRSCKPERLEEVVEGGPTSLEDFVSTAPSGSAFAALADISRGEPRIEAAECFEPRPNSSWLPRALLTAPICMCDMLGKSSLRRRGRRTVWACRHLHRKSIPMQKSTRPKAPPIEMTPHVGRGHVPRKGRVRGLAAS